MSSVVREPGAGPGACPCGVRVPGVRGVNITRYGCEFTLDQQILCIEMV